MSYLKNVIVREMNTFTEKLKTLETNYEALSFQRKLLRQTEADVEKVRSELPSEILAFYDQLRVVHTLKGDAASIDDSDD